MMVGGWEGELPSIASGEREEREGDREQRLMVVTCGEREEEKFITMTTIQSCRLSYLHFASVQL